ncbi:hypothetical protein ABFS82_03G088600 [Erythranthe guttata]|uniref:dof zinc finger protein DOF1.2 n=1 Tax=Erythranthe guttata TaxID=4155 RepID=UPI00064DEB35|nr:PREDICTED: dof zinc finger protein DOF1.2 [Erythranthe guttata]|eukprot:XP_012829500.1 PREDICTED: dof zinc finger protein DOF1.2 [Erythranthe guttata]
MFISTTTSDHHQYSNSIVECPPPLRPMIMDTNSRKWNFTTKIETAPNCPRCASSNTKFCYYNNYSLSQPRYFCKACRRYWTKGGSLRNVPVGGGCRKTRRSRSSSSSAAAAAAGGGGGSHSGGESEGSTTCIDLAAVFANYVNQNAEDNDESFSFSPGGSSGSSENNVHQVNGGCLDLVNGGGDDQVQQVVPGFSVHPGIDGQDFVYQDCGDAFDQLQQGILGNHELAADHMLWSEGTNVPSFGSQNPTAEVPDFGLFTPDDQFRISADNWGSFDLSTYEIFSTP